MYAMTLNDKVINERMDIDHMNFRGNKTQVGTKKSMSKFEGNCARKQTLRETTHIDPSPRLRTLHQKNYRANRDAFKFWSLQSTTGGI